MTVRMAAGVAGILAAVFLSGCAGTTCFSDAQSSVVRVYASPGSGPEVQDASAPGESEGVSRQRQGSGVVLDSGYILTCAHILAGLDAQASIWVQSPSPNVGTSSRPSSWSRWCELPRTGATR